VSQIEQFRFSADTAGICLSNDVTQMRAFNAFLMARRKYKRSPLLGAF
jgi:hypothetical protein